MIDRAKIGAGLGCLANQPFWWGVERVHALGFESIEVLAYEGARHSIGLLPGIWLDGISDADFERLQAALSPFAHTSVHAPFVDAPLFGANRPIAQAALRQVRNTIAVAGRLRMEAVAVHANRRAGLDARDYWDEMLRVLRELGDVAREVGTLVGLETGFPDRYDEFLDLVRAVDHPGVGATLDVGHVAFLIESEPRGTEAGVLNYNRNLLSLVRDLGERLVHLHLHDVRLADWRDHRTLGTGIVELEPLVRGLADVGYAGLVQFELEEIDQEPALLASRRALEAAFASAGV